MEQPEVHHSYKYLHHSHLANAINCGFVLFCFTLVWDLRAGLR